MARLKFDGATSYVDFFQSVNDLSPAFEISLVVEFDGLIAGQLIDSSTIGNDFVQLEVAPGPVFRAQYGPFAVVDGTTLIQAGREYFVAMVWDGAKLRLFVDGVEEGVSADLAGIGIVDTVWRVGARKTGDGFFAGYIRDVRVWQPPLKTDPNNAQLARWYAMDDMETVEVVDKVSGEQRGTHFDTTWISNFERLPVESNVMIQLLDQSIGPDDTLGSIEWAAKRTSAGDNVNFSALRYPDKTGGFASNASLSVQVNGNFTTVDLPELDRWYLFRVEVGGGSGVTGHWVYVDNELVDQFDRQGPVEPLDIVLLESGGSAGIVLRDIKLRNGGGTVLNHWPLNEGSGTTINDVVGSRSMSVVNGDEDVDWTWEDSPVEVTPEPQQIASLVIGPNFGAINPPTTSIGSLVTSPTIGRSFQPQDTRLGSRVYLPLVTRTMALILDFLGPMAQLINEPRRIAFAAVDTSGNGITTGLTFEISINGGAFAAPTNAIVNTGNGGYTWLPTVAEVSQPGEIVWRLSAADLIPRQESTNIYDPQSFWAQLPVSLTRLFEADMRGTATGNKTATVFETDLDPADPGRYAKQSLTFGQSLTANDGITARIVSSRLANTRVELTLSEALPAIPVEGEKFVVGPGRFEE